ncbi:phosphotransferase family protein [Rhodococcus sp. 14C212]|uniref:phosphotransferase family protein n=1 Tax=Rhodococcus sp. 14C212 TaxID=2711209 RepID=UPI0013EA2869|nr:phosphotransferase family protein [Rhodococcus sp. 14C212]NGP06745.1 phosphotransferase family protein [Rhodococcus sp. 14C212]
MTGGASSLTFQMRLTLADDTEQRVVAKVAPPGLAPVKNRNVLRQAKIMRSLEARAVIPVPTIYLEDGGEPPGTPPLFLMEHIEGDCWEPLLDQLDLGLSTTEVCAREIDAARVLGQLHSVDPHDIGLADERVVPLQDELDRWVKVIGTLDEDVREHSEPVTRKLRVAMPPQVEPVLQHGDFRLGNTLATNGRIAAVIDWEIWSVGDPRVDLGWFLMSSDPSKQAMAIREVAGLPSASELLAAYESASGRKVTDLGWFEALAQFKAAAITAQILKHNRRRAEQNPIVNSWDPELPKALLDSAARILDDHVS